MKNRLTSSHVENQLMMIMMTLMIIKHHPGGGRQAKYVVSLIPLVADRFAFLSARYRREKARGGGIRDNTNQRWDLDLGMTDSKARVFSFL